MSVPILFLFYFSASKAYEKYQTIWAKNNDKIKDEVLSYINLKIFKNFLGKNTCDFVKVALLAFTNTVENLIINQHSYKDGMENLCIMFMI